MKNKKKENKKSIFILIGIFVVVSLLGGGTYAYLSWQSAENQQTVINIKVSGGGLRIVGNVVTAGDKETKSTVLRPTDDCDGAAALVGKATVTAFNETNNSMTATLKLDATLTRTHSNTYFITTTSPGIKEIAVASKCGTNGYTCEDARSYLKWAIVETNDTFTTTDDACNSPAYSGNFAGIDSSTGISTGITYTVAANTAQNEPLIKYYKIYIWLDETYQFTNTGSTITDPMEDLKAVVKWSTSSTLTNAPQ